MILSSILLLHLFPFLFNCFPGALLLQFAHNLLAVGDGVHKLVTAIMDAGTEFRDRDSLVNKFLDDRTRCVGSTIAWSAQLCLTIIIIRCKNNIIMLICNHRQIICINYLI